MIVHDYNMFASFIMLDDDPVSKTYRDLSTWRAATGLDVHSLSGEPGILNANSTNVRSFGLARDSKCRGAGRIGGVPGGAAVDIGAWGTSPSRIGCDFAALTPNAPTQVS